MRRYSARYLKILVTFLSPHIYITYLPINIFQQIVNFWLYFLFLKKYAQINKNIKHMKMKRDLIWLMLGPQ